MWRKIRSNRDPRDTLYSEIRKEFSAYFNSGEHRLNRITRAHPRLVFYGMIALMSLSLILSFSVFRHRDAGNKTIARKVNPVTDGFSQIMQVSGNIRETLQLKHLVDSLTAKQTLSSSDSALLDSALDRLGTIRQKLK